MRNLILATDSYKVSHHLQYPPDTTRVYSYFESRGGMWPKTMFFGLQYILMRFLVGPVVTMDHIDEAEEAFRAHFLGGAPFFNRAGWERIVKEHGGYLPVEIRAVPEGSLIDNYNVLMTVENTDPELPWLTNYLETLLCQVWYPSTVATQGAYIRAYMDGVAKLDGSDPISNAFKLHDFGFRGVSSSESAGIGGLAHLVNFAGTDTMEALLYARNFYDEPMAGYSIPAAEHSTITSWGGPEDEVDAFQNMIQQFGDQPVYAVVSDSWDIFHAVQDLWGDELRELVIQAPGMLVVRPDSGDPKEVVMRVLRTLQDSFGSTVNEKGKRVLKHVRVIQGDGVNEAVIRDILSTMYQSGYAIENIAFGMGGALLQKLNRDTQKASKRGRMKLSYGYGSGDASTVRQDESSVTDYMRPVFRDGIMHQPESLKIIRERAERHREILGRQDAGL